MIVLVYGIPKSASTFVTEICRSICEAAGFDQKKLREDYLPENLKYGYISLNNLDIKKTLENIPEEEFLVLKTHDGFTADVKNLRKMGKLKTIITYRHPADCSLSAYEAGVKARNQKDYSQSFYKLDTIKDAIDFISSHVNGVNMKYNIYDDDVSLRLSYEYVVNNPVVLAKSISEYIGLGNIINGERLTRAVSDLATGNKRVYNFNVGKIGRHKEVFTQEELEYSNQQFENFLKRFYS
jgi:hypothetical protein